MHHIVDSTSISKNSQKNMNRMGKKAKNVNSWIEIAKMIAVIHLGLNK